LWLLESGTVRFVGGTGIGDAMPTHLSVVPVESDLPAAEVLRTGRAVTYASRSERDARWPSLSMAESPSEATAVLPLTVHDRPLGCLHIGFPSADQDFDLPFLYRV